MSDKQQSRKKDNGNDKERSKSRSRSRSRSPRRENIALDAKNRLKSIGIQMKLNAKQKNIKPKLTIASAFNQDSDDEPKEMPPEAKMRMRNIGRDTPTSSGPNSFGKTKHGFSDPKRAYEKNLTLPEN